MLVALAGHAAIAIETAQQAASMARHRAGLEQLLEVSSTLTAAQSTDEILRTVCRGIHSALGFQKVSIELVETETGMLRSRAAAGWEADDPAVLRPLPFDPVRELFDPAFEVSGCYLLPNEEARKRIDSAQIKYMSQNNGRGPHAWNHHWLIVPLYDREGEAFGVIWADDPDDRLLPSADRLQALRVFANQATTALLAAEQFEKMRFLADHDPLTNLLNRRSFVRQLDAEVARSRRYNRPLALLVFDLNELKSLNDTYGHAAGDEALQLVADHVVRGPPARRPRVPHRRRRVRRAPHRGDRDRCLRRRRAHRAFARDGTDSLGVEAHGELRRGRVRGRALREQWADARRRRRDVRDEARPGRGRLRSLLGAA